MPFRLSVVQVRVRVRVGVGVGVGVRVKVRDGVRVHHNSLVGRVRAGMNLGSGSSWNNPTLGVGKKRQDICIGRPVSRRNDE